MVMRIPKSLKGEARAFWHRHAARCNVDEQTVDAFTLLCRTYEMLQGDFTDDKGTIRYVALTKAFERQGIQFGITSKKRVEAKRDLQRVIQEGLKHAEQDEDRSTIRS